VLDKQRVLPMAGRHATKASGKSASVAARTPRAKAKAGLLANTLTERLAALERERNALRDELERTQQRVRQLEEAQARVRDRVAWALDTLRNILERKA
jgi:chromosome segregation ATPase